MQVQGLGYIDTLGKQKETTRTGFVCLPSSQSDQHTGVMPPSIIMSLPLNCIEEAFQSMLYVPRRQLMPVMHMTVSFNQNE